MHGNYLRVQYLQRRIGMYKTFGKHPSDKLQKIFTERPFQIQIPEKAKVIFLSLDANFDINIENNISYFNETLSYLSDGVKYWETEKIHTPMRRHYYKGNGKRYHEQFSKLGFTSKNAKDICFMELLNVCTFGSSTTPEGKIEYAKLLLSAENQSHLKRIALLANDKNKLIVLVGAKTKEYIQKLKLFNINSDNIIVCTHFSAPISDEYLHNLGTIVSDFLLKHE